MTTIIGDPVQQEHDFPIYAYPATLGEEVGATVEGTLATNPVTSLANVASEYFDRAVAARMPKEYTLTADEANAQYGDIGLKFDRTVSQSYAAQLAKDKNAEIERSKIYAASPGGFGRGVAKFGAGLAASMTDPLNIGAAFIPVVGEARFAAMAGSMGIRTARVAKGAIEGAVGTALIEPITYAGAKAHQYEYGLADSLMNLAFGTVLGGGLHFAGGEIADAWKARKSAALAKGEPLPEPTGIAETVDNFAAPDRAEILRTAVGQMAAGRDIKVDDWIDALKERQAAQAPAPRDFELGTLEKDRYSNYTPLSPKDKAGIEGAVAELQQTEGGRRIFKEADGQGGTAEVTGYKGNTPQWFTDYNNAATEVNKARAAAIKRGGPVQAAAKLPRELAGAKPRYGFKDKQFTIGFESDVDKALYITAQTTRSRRDADYRNFLRDQGMDDKTIKAQGAAMRDKIKAMAKDAEPGQLTVKAEGKPAASNIPASQSILTREKVAQVAKKMAAGEPLGRNEGLIAQHLFAVGRGAREENVRQMLEYRTNRASDRQAELDEYFRREEGNIGHDAITDGENTIKVAQELPQDFQTHLQELDDKINAEWQAGTLNEAEMNAIDEADAAVKNSESAGKGLLAAATCIFRKL